MHVLEIFIQVSFTEDNDCGYLESFFSSNSAAVVLCQEEECCRLDEALFSEEDAGMEG